MPLVVENDGLAITSGAGKSISLQTRCDSRVLADPEMGHSRGNRSCGAWQRPKASAAWYAVWAALMKPLASNVLLVLPRMMSAA